MSHFMLHSDDDSSILVDLEGICGAAWIHNIFYLVKYESEATTFHWSREKALQSIDRLVAKWKQLGRKSERVDGPDTCIYVFLLDSVHAMNEYSNQTEISFGAQFTRATPEDTYSRLKESLAGLDFFEIQRSSGRMFLKKSSLQAVSLLAGGTLRFMRRMLHSLDVSFSDPQAVLREIMEQISQQQELVGVWAPHGDIQALIRLDCIGGLYRSGNNVVFYVSDVSLPAFTFEVPNAREQYEAISLRLLPRKLV